MVNFEKITKSVDIVLNCIPGLNIINGAAQALYKLAHKVDTLNPVAPGLKTTIKIHILSKDNLRCFLESLPIIGNLIALGDLILTILYGFGKEDHLKNAVRRHNTEVVRLCLANGALGEEETRKDGIFSLACHSTTNAVFLQVLDSREDWSAKDLMRGLALCSFSSNDAERSERAEKILLYFAKKNLSLNNEDIAVAAATLAIQDFLKKGQVDLAERIIQILPENVGFADLQDLLLEFSCVQYGSKGNPETKGTLSVEQQNALITKSKKPSLTELKNYYNEVAIELKSNQRPDAPNYRKIHFDILDQLVQQAKLPDEELGQFIAYTLHHDVLDFSDHLLLKHNDQLSSNSKVKILEKLLPLHSNDLQAHTRRTQLFTSLIKKWTGSISPDEVHNLYEAIDKPTPHVGSLFESLGNKQAIQQSFQKAKTRFKQILLQHFPGCDKAPQKAS